MIENRYADAIDLLKKEFLKTNFFHDTPRSMHFALLLQNNRPVGFPVCNALNVFACSAGPRWIRQLSSSQDKSVHAEARVVQKNLYYQRNKANGVICCRFSASGISLLAKPCIDCVRIMSANNVKFVVYSDIDGNWCKESLFKMLNDETPYFCTTWERIRPRRDCLAIAKHQCRENCVAVNH